MKSLMFFLASVLSLSANSADIQVLPSSEESGFPPSRIIIEGQFVEGDFEKLLSKIFELPSAELPIRWLALNDSAGGDLMEAMKIGELIKELYLQTFVVGDCNSACAFVAMSSQFRVVIGSIGLHRPYFAPKYFKNMTPNQANEKYQQLHRLARSYLEKNYISTKTIDQMFSFSSTDIWVLSDEEATREIGYFQPPFQEWVKADCKQDLAGIGGIERECLLRKLSESQIAGFADFTKKINNITSTK